MIFKNYLNNRMRKFIIVAIIANILIGCNNTNVDSLNNEISLLNAENDSLFKRNIRLIDKTYSLENQNDSLFNRNIHLIDKTDSLEKLIKLHEDFWFNEDFNRISFDNFYTKDSEERIEKALKNKPELIPTEAQLGGTMFFGRSRLFGRKWIIATYSDGHIEGKAIYQFKMIDNGDLEFTLLCYRIY